jgi:hypothetical protein
MKSGIEFLEKLTKLRKAGPAFRMKATFPKKLLLMTNDYGKGEK